MPSYFRCCAGWSWPRSFSKAMPCRRWPPPDLLGLRRHPSRSLWPRAWELRTNLSAHDALYVALAEQLKAPLLTADARLARAPGLRCPVDWLGREQGSSGTTCAPIPG